MIRTTLKQALDFSRARRKKGEPEPPHEKFSYQHDGKWFVCNRGPTYCNIYEVTEYDDEGLKVLQNKEQKEEDR